MVPLGPDGAARVKGSEEGDGAAIWPPELSGRTGPWWLGDGEASRFDGLSPVSRATALDVTALVLLLRATFILLLYLEGSTKSNSNSNQIIFYINFYYLLSSNPI